MYVLPAENLTVCFFSPHSPLEIISRPFLSQHSGRDLAQNQQF